MSEQDALDGRVALVTGATAGIGRATALALASAGATVVLTARREGRLDEVAAAIEGSGGTALPIACDVTDLDGVRALVATTLERFARIDILVNNAGIMSLGPLSEARVDEWTRMVAVNVNGALHLVGAVLPAMIERGAGHVINVGSVAGRRPFPGGTVYAATKFALRALSWGMHLELGAAHGIRVTDIQPGYVATELLDSDPETKAAWDAGWADRRTLQPEDVARAILFAATSPDHVSVSEILVRPTDQPT
jgi:hypothetical protein